MLSRKDRPISQDSNSLWMSFAISLDLRERINSHVLTLAFKKKAPSSRSRIIREAIEEYLRRDKAKEKS
jgi:metal-responsive CopG/Arc/MetJ family transcriptional regulator